MTRWRQYFIEGSDGARGERFLENNTISRRLDHFRQFYEFAVNYMLGLAHQLLDAFELR
jgi:hypothetical protein